MLKPIPIGYENFKEVIDKGCYYIDKTTLIKGILDSTAKVQLFTRPRRFGKTLNMSMLRYFFEKSDEDNRYLFRGLKISEHEEKYAEHMGKYPVITLSLKSMKQDNFDDAFVQYKRIIREEFERHRYILDFEAFPNDRKVEFKSILSNTADNSFYPTALKFLSDCLWMSCNKKIIILIDEYDVPLEGAYLAKFYDKMVSLIRTAFESALKTNDSLERGVLTGCLRISRESIFTGLNNLAINSVLSLNYSECFGFTELEVAEMAEYYGISDRFSDIKNWYDGYLFGKTEIYNPWSVVNFMAIAKDFHDFEPENYWANTSSNSIIKQLIEEGSHETKELIEQLLAGESITAPIYEDITYRNIDVNSEYIWSFLLFTGYLKPIGGNEEAMKLVIPNNEVKAVYKDLILRWFRESVRQEGTSDLMNALINEDVELFSKELTHWLEKTISFQDSYENFYHGFLAGVLIGNGRYRVKSNRESGNGRSDIVVYDNRNAEVAIIIEIKVAKTRKELSAKCDAALKQIDDNNYAFPWIDEGYEKIVKYGIAFFKKTCMVKKA